VETNIKSILDLVSLGFFSCLALIFTTHHVEFSEPQFLDTYLFACIGPKAWVANVGPGSPVTQQQSPAVNLAHRFHPN